MIREAKVSTEKLIIFLLITFSVIVIPAYNVSGETESNPFPVPISDDFTNRDIYNTIKTRWVDPMGSSPITYEEWKSKSTIRGEFTVTPVITGDSSGNRAADTKICLIVNSTLYAGVQSSFGQYVQDLTGEGYIVEVYTTSGGSPEDLRGFIQSRYSTGTEGFLFLGDLPVAWYETDFGDPPEHAEFPIDLYYMDIDGVFTDGDGDGKYDNHTGDVTPEVWMGRLTASPLIMDGADEVSLVNNYFYKNHKYRCGLSPLNNRALVYIDDDWASAGPYWGANVGLAYGNRMLITEEWTTWAPDYESRLDDNFELIEVCVHSWPGGHSFKNPEDNWTTTYNWEIKSIGPVAHFYNLFACSNALYVENDYCSGWYIFQHNYGLAAVGSTKSGSMLAFEDFYGPFGEGATIGEAFRDWFAARAAGGFTESEISWHYGMTLNGDPTLTIQKESSRSTLQYYTDAAYMLDLTDGGGLDLFNVRFTAEEYCTLSAVSFTGWFPGDVELRMYVLNSDGRYPTAVIDSFDIPHGELGYVELYDRNITFNQNDNFHIGFSLLDPSADDTAWFYMDAGTASPDGERSGLKDAGVPRTLYEIWATSYNFIISVEVTTPPEPSVEITTLTLPGCINGSHYDERIDFTGGQAPYFWEIAAGELPEGIGLDPGAGILNGTISKYGDFSFTVRITDSSDPALSDFQHYNMTVNFACGDVNADGIRNLTDILILVQYVYVDPIGEPALDPTESGDVNSDTNINLADILDLISNIYVEPLGQPVLDCP